MLVFLVLLTRSILGHTMKLRPKDPEEEQCRDANAITDKSQDAITPAVVQSVVHVQHE